MKRKLRIAIAVIFFIPTLPVMGLSIPVGILFFLLVALPGYCWAWLTDDRAGMAESRRDMEALPGGFYYPLHLWREFINGKNK